MAGPRRWELCFFSLPCKPARRLLARSPVIWMAAPGSGSERAHRSGLRRRGLSFPATGTTTSATPAPNRHHVADAPVSCRGTRCAGLLRPCEGDGQADGRQGWRRYDAPSARRVDGHGRGSLLPRSRHGTVPDPEDQTERRLVRRLHTAKSVRPVAAMVAQWPPPCRILPLERLPYGGEANTEANLKSLSKC